MTAVSPPNLPPPPTTTTTTTPTYAISFRTPLWLAGPPRNESPARSPRRDIAQNEWGLRSYFQGKTCAIAANLPSHTPASALAPGASSLSVVLANEGSFPGLQLSHGALPPLCPLPSASRTVGGGDQSYCRGRGARGRSTLHSLLFLSFFLFFFFFWSQ